jgi:hypothetical protein
MGVELVHIGLQRALALYRPASALCDLLQLKTHSLS